MDWFISAYSLCILLLFYAGGRAETWTGVVKSLTTPLNINTALHTYATAALDISVTVTAGDKVLLFANMGTKSTSTTVASFLTQTIFRGTTDISGGNSAKFFGASVPKEASEIMDATVVYMDTPSVGTFTYSIRGSGAITYSPNSQTRQFAAMIIPDSFPTKLTTYSTMKTFTTTGFVTANLDNTITPLALTDRVLVSVNINFNPTALPSAAKYSLFRNGVQVDNYALQTVRGSATGSNKYATFIYMDTPNSVASVAYSVRVAKEATGDASVDICDGNFDVAQMSLVAFPYHLVESDNAIDTLTITSTNWVDIGLSVTVTTQLPTDKVMVTVNVNVSPVSAATIVSLSIFRDTTNLGHATYGLQSVKVPVAAETSIGTMTFMDAPTTAGTYTYKARAKVVSGSVVISKSGQTRQIAAITTNSPTAAPSASPSRAPTFTPTANPTTNPTPYPSRTPSVIPTAPPTREPTIIPTAQPTITPSAAPTLEPLDCTVYCALGDFVVSKGLFVRNLILPPYFTITFIATNVVPSGSTALRPNLFDLVDVESGVSLLAAATTQNTSLRLIWDGNVVQQYGVRTYVDPATPATINAHVYADLVRWRSSVNNPYTPWTPIANTRVTNRLYTLYLSNPTDPSAGGNLGNVRIVGDVPTTMPTTQPSPMPSATPSEVPTAVPSVVPTCAPSVVPTLAPSANPSAVPSVSPTADPTVIPSADPSALPSEVPTLMPTVDPTLVPTTLPTETPTLVPSVVPSVDPSADPTVVPSVVPSADPSVSPSNSPTEVPSAVPTVVPSVGPTTAPTELPSAVPTVSPSTHPSAVPTVEPTRTPTASPSAKPTLRPSVIRTSAPSVMDAPSVLPTEPPTADPTAAPSIAPTDSLTEDPTASPSVAPSAVPSVHPTVAPTLEPTVVPTVLPSSEPSSQPSSQPSGHPSTRPSAQPSCHPSTQPSAQPTRRPSAQPSGQPSVRPSAQPSCQPSQQPTVHPSTQPTSKPSAQPSNQPSSVPSVQPSDQPSVQPSTQPSGRPSAQPTARPSSQPSTRPSSQPTVRPSVQPSGQPSSQPSGQPSRQPTSQPSGQPSRQPLSRPTAQPSSQPSRRPSAQPSSQPSSQPTSSPSLFGTDEWVSVVNSTVLFKALSVVNGSVWACGEHADLTRRSASCSLANAVTGKLSTQFQFPWDTITSAIVTNDNTKIMVSGRITSATGVVSSEVATCTVVATILSCVVKSFQSANFVKASYNTLGEKFVYVGQNAHRAAVSLFDRGNNSVSSFVYTAVLMNAITLTQVVSPVNFVGSFVAGTSVSTSTSAAINIFAGWLRTDTGQMAAAIGITPVSGNIVSTTDLVTSMSLEEIGPDLFIAGGLHLDDVTGRNMYLLRANSLYKTIQYGARYVPKVVSNRRVLTTSLTSTFCVARGLALTDSALFIIADVVKSNKTSLAVLKIVPLTGAIVKQAQVSSPTGNLLCTDITSTGVLLTIACTVQETGASLRSLLIAVDRELTFFELPTGFYKHGQDTFRQERVPFKSTIVTMKSPNSNVQVVESSLVTSDKAPSLSPTVAPTLVPSAQPTSSPSAQPSSNPTAAPTVSAHPTSHPSTSGPTSTPKPTHAPTIRVTVLPSAVGTARPTFVPTLLPSLRPTVSPTTTVPTTVPSTHKPSVEPSAVPTVTPSVDPSARPTRVPTEHPTASTAPSLAPTLVDAKSGTSDERETFMISASVGAAVCLGLCGFYLVYRRKLRNAKSKVAMEKRKSISAVPVSTSEFTPSLVVVPSTPSTPAVVPVVATWRVRESTKYASSADPSVGKSRSAGSSSAMLSSLHSSEHSLLNCAPSGGENKVEEEEWSENGSDFAMSSMHSSELSFYDEYGEYGEFGEHGEEERDEREVGSVGNYESNSKHNEMCETNSSDKNESFHINVHIGEGVNSEQSSPY